MYMLRKSRICWWLGALGFGVMITLSALGFPVGVFDLFHIFVFAVILPVVLMAVNTFQITRKPTTCVTTITEFGISDETEKYKKIYLPWRKVRSIQFDKGSVYFMGFAAHMYVPYSAFESERDALEFYRQAQQFWNNARGVSAPQLTSSEDHVFKLEDDMQKKIQAYEDGEEAVWKQMEEVHRKQQG